MINSIELSKDEPPNKTVLLPKICPKSKRLFTPKRTNIQKFCSQECARKEKTIKVEAPHEIRACLWCHAKFEARRTTPINPHVFCSQECGGLYRHMKKKIFNKYCFESDKRFMELERLKLEGQKYVFEA
jgi:hypothetical protein